MEPLDSEPMDTSDPATQMTNNYDMPILSESPQLSPSLDLMDSKFSSAQTSGPAAASVDLAASSPKLDKYMGRPEKPPSSAYSLFSKEMLNTEAIKQFPSKERMSHISEAWKQVVRGSVNVLD